jgi:outer membrane protein OmpA-like peptidoglycan-associated protein
MKYMKGIYVLLLGFVFNASVIYSQGQVIHLTNPSFESIPKPGGKKFFFLPGWYDCAPYYFYNETPPDIHGENTGFFDVNRIPQDGNTFLGMVTRGKRETWEMVTQQLPEPMLKGKCYEFSIHLAKSNNYYSGVDPKDTIPKNFNTPVKLRIWGSNMRCKKTQLLAQSETIKNQEWEKYTFRFKPNRNYFYIMFEAFYKTPVLVPYNGNILLDNASDIVEIPCPGDEVLAKVDIEKAKPSSIVKTAKTKIKTPKTVSKPKSEEDKNAIVEKKDKTTKKEKILKKLDKNIISAGQTIKIENLYFDADSSRIKPESYAVLNEIYNFLRENPNVIIEIGGHTNGLPANEYCNKLSTARAKNVAEYLYDKGIPKYRIKYKGYGKSQPLASNKTAWGRKQNQRVEIKILKIK